MKHKTLCFLFASLLILSACAGKDDDSTPTVDANLIQTQAIETYSAALTQTALAAPTKIPPFPTLTASPTFAPFTTSAEITLPATTQSAAASPTATCYQLRFVSDVSIPDNTPMAPGQTFTKTWKVKNTGSCAWEAGFKFSFVGGEAMNGTTYTLPSSVATGAELDISVAMTAPANKTGTLRSNWRMSTAGGQFFGDEVYVLIVVGGATLTPTKGAGTPAATNVTPSATPSTPTTTPPTPDVVITPSTSP